MWQPLTTSTETLDWPVFSAKAFDGRVVLTANNDITNNAHDRTDNLDILYILVYIQFAILLVLSLAFCLTFLS